MKQRKTYPLADRVSLETLARMGITNGVIRGRVKAVWTGEKRPPKAGEWYLSGAVIEAYQAKNDMTTTYYIARLVKVTLMTVEVIED